MEGTSAGEPNATDTIDVLKCLRCGQEGCTNVPGFGYQGEGPTLCSEHAAPSMVQIVALRCEQVNCNSRRTFGFDGGEARLCANHKIDGMVDLMKRRSQCVVSNCTKLSTYGYDGFLARYCFSHKSTGMVYLKNRKRLSVTNHPPKSLTLRQSDATRLLLEICAKCEFYECTRQPTYGMDGQRAKFCSSHKEEGMIDVKNCRCKHPGCTRQPNYGHEGGRAKYCSSHKLAKMVNVVSRRCEFPACKRQPIYGFEGGKATFCPTHRVDSMTDVVNRHCEFNGCTKTPSYGYVGERAQFCSHHHLPDMEDVKNRRCGWHECRRYPIFGHEGERAQFCSAHKTDDMVNVRNRRCEDGSCTKLPTHGFPGEKAKACQAHIKPGMVNLKGRKNPSSVNAPKREGDVSIRLGALPMSGGARGGRSPEPDFDTPGPLGGAGGGGGGPGGDRGYWGMGHRGAMGRGGGRGPEDDDMYGGNGGPMMGWGMRGGDGPGSGNASPTGVLGDRKYAAPEDQGTRLRRLAAEVDLREQRQRAAQEQQELKAQQIRSMQSNIPRRPMASTALDQNFYGGTDDYHPHIQLGMPPRSQPFLPGGGSSGMMPRRPLSREPHEIRAPPHGYRDQPNPQQGRGYGNPGDYGFVPQMNNPHGYGPGPAGEGDLSGAPVSGVLGGRANLRPPQSRVSVQQPRARRVLPPSPGRSASMSAVMDGGFEGGRQGGSLSPFVGHQPSSHLRLPLPPVMPGSFNPSFQGLDWDVAQDPHGEAGGSNHGGHGGQAGGDGDDVAGGGGGGGGGGPSAWTRDGGVPMGHVDYPHQDPGHMGGVGVDDGRAGAEGSGAGPMDLQGGGGGGARSGAGPPGAFGTRLPAVDLSQGMIPHFGRDSSPGPFLGSDVNGGPGAHGGGGAAGLASPHHSVNDLAVASAARPLSPLMTSLAESGESPPGLPRLRTLNSTRGQEANHSSYAQPYLGGSTSSPLGPDSLSSLQHQVSAPPDAPAAASRSSPSFDALSGAGHGQGGISATGGHGDTGAGSSGGVAGSSSGAANNGSNVDNTPGRPPSARDSLDTRGNSRIDGRHSQDRGAGVVGGPGGGGQADGLFGGAPGVDETRAMGGRAGGSSGGGGGGLDEVGAGGGNDEADGDDSRKRLRIEELLH